MGHRLADVSLLCQKTGPAPARYSSRIYGDCTATGATDCAPPLEIQNWPECARDYASYGRSALHALTLAASRRITGQAVPAVVVNPTQIELYEARTTVVVFADHASLARRAARALARRIAHRTHTVSFQDRRQAALRAQRCPDE
ncbi:MAG TPA: hypothetical protein VF257_01555 [Solirubrobacteraceae bacterium]